MRTDLPETVVDMAPLKIVSIQEKIIEAQAEIIDDIFLQLMQLTTVEEMDSGCLEKISRVARAQREIE